MPYIKDDYISVCNFLGKDISVQVFNDKKSGTAEHINNNGELVLKQGDGEFVLTMGDIL